MGIANNQDIREYNYALADKLEGIAAGLSTGDLRPICVELASSEPNIRRETKFTLKYQEVEEKSVIVPGAIQVIDAIRIIVQTIKKKLNTRWYGEECELVRYNRYGATREYMDCESRILTIILGDD